MCSSAYAMASEGCRGVEGTFRISRRAVAKVNAVGECSAGIERDAHRRRDCTVLGNSRLNGKAIYFWIDAAPTLRRALPDTPMPA